MSELAQVTQLLVQLKGDADRLSAQKASLESEVFSLSKKRDSLLIETATAMDAEFSKERARLKEWDERLSGLSKSLKAEQDTNREENGRIEAAIDALSDEKKEFSEEKRQFLADSEAFDKRRLSIVAEEAETARKKRETERLHANAVRDSENVRKSSAELEKNRAELEKEREEFEKLRKLSAASFEEREKSLQSEKARLASEWAAVKSAKEHIDNLRK